SILVAALCAASAVAPPARGQSPALSYNSIVTSTSLDGYTLGFQFQTDAPLLITHLGYYDYANNGLTNPHVVGIYALSPNLLVPTTVSSSDTLAIGGGDNFTFYRYHDIPDFLLPQGTYRIGGTSNVDGVDNWHMAPIGLTNAAHISLQGA